MPYKIEDITEEYFPNQDENVFLWYRSRKTYPNLKSINTDIEEALNDFSYGHNIEIYKNIINSAINYFYDHRKEYKKNRCNVHILIAESSKYTRGHESDENGYIEIATLLLQKRPFKLMSLAYNPQMLSDRIKLRIGNDDYENEMEEEDPGGKINEETCPICMSNIGNIQKTNCGHHFHVKCLKSSPRLQCPICRNDVTESLKKFGVNQEEITWRIDNYKREQLLDEHLKTLYEVQYDRTNTFIQICMETLNLMNGDITGYFDLIYRINSDASDLFYKISEIQKKKKTPGVFVYTYDTPQQLIFNMINPNAPSVVTWMSFEEFEEKLPYDETELCFCYAVVVIIDNILTTKLIDNDTWFDNEHPIRYPDITHTLITGNLFDYDDEMDEETDEEFYIENKDIIWANKFLKTLKSSAKRDKDKKPMKNKK